MENILKERCILPLELLSWIDKAAVDNPPKEIKLDVCQPLEGISNQFGSCVTDADALTMFSKGFVPDNTKQNTQWAVRTFEAWSTWRNGVYEDDRVPGDILSSSDSDAVALNEWLSLCVIETRKQDGFSSMIVLHRSQGERPSLRLSVTFRKLVSHNLN